VVEVFRGIIKIEIVFHSEETIETTTRTLGAVVDKEVVLALNEEIDTVLRTEVI
jgi:hypothetical protein